MEQIKNEGQVALEMRNSPKVVKGHYFEIVDERRASTAPISKSGEFSVAGKKVGQDAVQRLRPTFI